MDDCAIVTLPGGWWFDGKCYWDAQLRPLNGADEAFLVNAGENLLAAQRTTTLLARALTRIGPLEPVTTEAVRQLTAGDREALLLHLRTLTLGPRMQCVLSCPNPECTEKIDFDVDSRGLLLPVYSDQKTEHRLTLQTADHTYFVTVRLPNGADLETAAPVACTDPDAAGALLLDRCVEKVTSDGQQLETDFPPALAAQISARLAELDPQSELIINLTCPACGQSFSSMIDAGSFFYKEIKNHLKTLYLETHLLAFHYHWSEAEIMGLSATKRRRYLELLQTELDRESRV
jgi:hypothetical protein